MYRPHRPVPIPSMPWGCADISTMRQHGNNGALCSFLLSLTCFCTQVPSAHVGVHDPPPIPICLCTCTACPCATCPCATCPCATCPCATCPHAHPLTCLLTCLPTCSSACSLAHSLIHPPLLPILPPVLPFSCPFSHSPAHSPILPLIRPFSHSFAHLTGGSATPSTGDGDTTPSRQHMAQHDNVAQHTVQTACYMATQW